MEVAFSVVAKKISSGPKSIKYGLVSLEDKIDYIADRENNDDFQNFNKKSMKDLDKEILGKILELNGKSPGSGSEEHNYIEYIKEFNAASSLLMDISSNVIKGEDLPSKKIIINNDDNIKYKNTIKNGSEDSMSRVNVIGILPSKGDYYLGRPDPRNSGYDFKINSPIEVTSTKNGIVKKLTEEDIEVKYIALDRYKDLTSEIKMDPNKLKNQITDQFSQGENVVGYRIDFKEYKVEKGESINVIGEGKPITTDGESIDGKNGLSTIYYTFKQGESQETIDGETYPTQVKILDDYSIKTASDKYIVNKVSSYDIGKFIEDLGVKLLKNTEDTELDVANLKIFNTQTQEEIGQEDILNNISGENKKIKLVYSYKDELEEEKTISSEEIEIVSREYSIESEKRKFEIIKTDLVNGYDMEKLVKKYNVKIKTDGQENKNVSDSAYITNKESDFITNITIGEHDLKLGAYDSLSELNYDPIPIIGLELDVKLNILDETTNPDGGGNEGEDPGQNKDKFSMRINGFKVGKYVGEESEAFKEFAKNSGLKVYKNAEEGQVPTEDKVVIKIDEEEISAFELMKTERAEIIVEVIYDGGKSKAKIPVTILAEGNPLVPSDSYQMTIKEGIEKESKETGYSKLELTKDIALRVRRNGELLINASEVGYGESDIKVYNGDSEVNYETLLKADNKNKLNNLEVVYTDGDKNISQTFKLEILLVDDISVELKGDYSVINKNEYESEDEFNLTKFIDKANLRLMLSKNGKKFEKRNLDPDEENFKFNIKSIAVATDEEEDSDVVVDALEGYRLELLSEIEEMESEKESIKSIILEITESLRIKEDNASDDQNPQSTQEIPETEEDPEVEVEAEANQETQQDLEEVDTTEGESNATDQEETSIRHVALAIDEERELEELNEELKELEESLRIRLQELENLNSESIENEPKRLEIRPFSSPIDQDISVEDFNTLNNISKLLNLPVGEYELTINYKDRLEFGGESMNLDLEETILVVIVDGDTTNPVDPNTDKNYNIGLNVNNLSFYRGELTQNQLESNIKTAITNSINTEIETWDDLILGDGLKKELIFRVDGQEIIVEEVNGNISISINGNVVTVSNYKEPILRLLNSLTSGNRQGYLKLTLRNEDGLLLDSTSDYFEVNIQNRPTVDPGNPGDGGNTGGDDDDDDNYYPGGGNTGGGSSTIEKNKDIKIDKNIEKNKGNSGIHKAYLKGYEDGTIRPEASISREEVATILYRLFSDQYIAANRSIASIFTDVKEGRWSNEAIATMANGNIITGYEDKSFKPEQNITRAEVLALINRFAQARQINLNATTEGINFTDINGHWAQEYIKVAANKNWINGYAGTSEFKPDQAITRGEFIAILNKVLNRTPVRESIYLDVKKFNDLGENKWYYLDIIEATTDHNYEVRDGKTYWTTEEKEENK